MSKGMDACALVAIGDELLAGKHPDLNSPWIADRLLDLDLRVDRVVMIEDDERAIADQFVELARSHAFVISTGGLGPTLDDVTRHAAARAAGVGLEQNDEALRELNEYFTSRGYEMTEANARQALFPEGARMVPNAAGTAPGFRVAVEGTPLFCLPGPPREVHVVFDEEVLPSLRSELERERASGSKRSVVRKRPFFLFGLAESVFADRVGDWMERDANPLMGVSVKSGVLAVTLRARAATEEEAERLLAERADEFRERFADSIFSEEDADLARAVGARALEANRRLTVAESCTGGMVASRLTDVPGISAVFSRGYVTYANEAKSELLGVAPELFEAHGAVSSQVAEAMARGALERAGADVAIAVTGVAGPDGGSAEKPVGLVWFGVANAEGVTSTKRIFPDRGREWVRRLATQTALDLFRRALPN